MAIVMWCILGVFFALGATELVVGGVALAKSGNRQD
jgi:hypothetical protein